MQDHFVENTSVKQFHSFSCGLNGKFRQEKTDLVRWSFRDYEPRWTVKGWEYEDPDAQALGKGYEKFIFRAYNLGTEYEVQTRRWTWRNLIAQHSGTEVRGNRVVRPADLRKKVNHKPREIHSSPDGEWASSFQTPSLWARARMYAWAGLRPQAPTRGPTGMEKRTPGRGTRLPTQAQATTAPYLQMNSVKPNTNLSSR